MQVYNGADLFCKKNRDILDRGTALTIGNFDGLHLGHRALIAEVLSKAQERSLSSVILTFAEHPVQVLTPCKTYGALFSREQLAEGLRAMGAEHLVFENFTIAFSQMSKEGFVKDYLVPFLNPKFVCVGENFLFGVHKSGSLSDLQEAGKQHNFEVRGLAPIKLDDEVISTSKIKQYLQEGRVDRVEKMLGRNYAVSGKVVEGHGRGRQIGFPTVNIESLQYPFLKKGVYGVKVTAQNFVEFGVANFGLAPSFQTENSQVMLEVHIFDFKGDLYGQYLNIEFLFFIREEQKFDSISLLVSQIQQDVTFAQKRLK